MPCGVNCLCDFCASIDNTLYEDDKLAIQTLAVDAQCQQSRCFARELACIKSIQLSIQAIGVITCASVLIRLSLCHLSNGNMGVATIVHVLLKKLHATTVIKRDMFFSYSTPTILY